MLILYISTLLLYTFGVFNILGIRADLFPNVIVFGIVGIGMILLIRRIGIQFFFLNAPFFYGVWVIILMGLLLFGVDIKGSRRWIELPFFSIQPAEIFKIFFIIYIARLLSHMYKHTQSLINTITILGLSIPPIILVFVQPDFGDAFVLGSILAILLLITKTTRKHIAIVTIIVIILSPLMWPLLHDYQQQRIVSFVNQDQDPQGTAYNMIQSIITVGSGGVWGKGLGYGTQTRLAFLPEYHTDFAYASLVEQFGFVGGTTVILLYAIAITTLAIKSIRLYNLQQQKHMTYFYIYTGVLIFLTTHVIVNIGMNIGILPVTGITLPFISYGGSSLLTWGITLGILDAIHRDILSEHYLV